MVISLSLGLSIETSLSLLQKLQNWDFLSLQTIVHLECFFRDGRTGCVRGSFIPQGVSCRVHSGQFRDEDQSSYAVNELVTCYLVHVVFVLS